MEFLFNLLCAVVTKHFIVFSYEAVKFIQNALYNNNHYYYLQGYLKSLGLSRTAQVKRDARIGEAEAQRDAGIKVMLFCLPVVCLCFCGCEVNLVRCCFHDTLVDC